MVLLWPAPLSRPLRPPPFLGTGGLTAPPAGAQPPAPRLAGREGFLLACQRARGRGWAGFPRLQPHSLIVCDSLIVCAPAFSSPVGVEPLQRRYEALQAVTKLLRVVTEPLRVVTQSLRSRYQSCEPLRSWAAQNKPVPYSGIRSGPSHPRRVLPLGVFPQRPCHRGTLHGEPPVPTVCGRLREREAGWRPTSLGAL